MRPSISRLLALESAAAAALALGALAPAPAAQTGPWTDGELIVRSTLPGVNTQALFRVAPETGHGELLLSGFNVLGWAGATAFDPWRNRLLLNGSLPPINSNLAKLWLIAADGSATSVPGFTGVKLRALAPVGDGRVFFQRHGTGVPNFTEYFDKYDVVHTLLDASGTQPFELRAEHLFYHAPTNSLIATTSAWWSPVDCVEGESSIYRLPLSLDGTRVVGPVLCNSISGEGSNIMTLDLLPDGDLLVSMSGAQFFKDTLRRVDPFTLASSTWASPSPVDLDGGVWSERAGRALVIDDGANVMRSYGPGGSGLGIVVPTDFNVSANTSGLSPQEKLTEIDLGTPGCSGEVLSLGPGSAAATGYVPSFAVSGCPDVGETFQLRIEDGPGGGTGWLALGFGASAAPLFEGTLYPAPISALIPVVLGGDPLVAGSGTLALPVTFTAPALTGLQLYLQGLFLDPHPAKVLTVSNGLRLTIG